MRYIWLGKSGSNKDAGFVKTDGLVNVKLTAKQIKKLTDLNLIKKQEPKKGVKK